MTDEQKIPRSYLLIEFAVPGSILMKITPENVSPFQLFAVAEYLKLIARSQIVKEQNEAEEQAKLNRIIVPEGQILKK